MNKIDNIIAIRKKSPDCAYDAFVHLMDKTQSFINDKAKRTPGLFTGISTSNLEILSTQAIKEMCQGTPFAPEKVILVSGHSFPDIVAEKYYGVEVKSTEKDKWTSTGSSIMESTRAVNVEHIYMLFAKLGGEKPEFSCRPYQDVLSGITVTHSPRYEIDMQLQAGGTIFDKMHVSYDELRSSPEAISRVRRYYRRQALQKGKNEMPWWLDTPVGMNLRLWSDLSAEDKKIIMAQLFILFPMDIIENKFDNIALWLCSTLGIVNSHIRDMFSAGGQINYVDKRRLRLPLPQVVRRAVNIAPTVRDYLSKPNDISLFLDDYNPCLSRENHCNLYDLWKKQVANLIDDKCGINDTEHWIDNQSVLETKI